MNRAVSIVICASLASASAVSAARAHSWYPLECCSGQDCHPVPCETLRENTNGSLTYLPTSTDFDHKKIRPSQDEHCHICTSSPDGKGYAYCAFTVQGF